MATYTSELDNALLPVSWMAKVDTNSKPYMTKYAPHPTKPGYITLLTDLTKVYFEPLAGIRVLARQREVEEKFGQSQSQRDGASSLDLGGEEAVDEVLEEITGLMGDMEDVEMEVKAGDLYDLDVNVKSPRGNWLYHMTEIRTDCLEIITRHVLLPLALSIASSRQPATTTNDQIVELVSSSTVLEAINRHSLHTKASASATAKAKSPKKAVVKSPTPARVEEKEEGGESSKSRLVRRRPGAITKPEDAGPSSPERTARTKSPSPIKARIDTHASRTAAHDDMEDDSMPPEEEDEEHRSSTPVSSAPSPARSRKKKASPIPTEDEEVDEDKSPTPPAPIPSQKTQQEKDEEEEEELARKREEMKRKMGAGKGGRLVRRRFG